MKGIDRPVKISVAIVEQEGGKVEPYTIELAEKVRANEITLEEAIKKVEERFLNKK